MSRMIGTVSRGVRAPIIRNGDNLAEIVTSSILEASADAGFEIQDRDIIAMTEAIVARAQGNYATIDDIASDVKAKFPEGEVGVIFPILSRNRFAICLKGIARGAKKVVLMLGYPSDEVGNQLVSLDQLDVHGIMSKPALSSSRIAEARLPCDFQLLRIFSSSGFHFSFSAEKSLP